MKKKIQKYRINENIRTEKVRLINDKGENIGILDLSQAVKLAKEKGLDVVEVSRSANPPVCKMLDYSKFIYEQKGKLKQSKSKKTALKEFQLRPKIGDGDLRIRIDRGRKFLQKGNMVKYTVKFRGREMAYPQIGEMKLKIIQSELSDVSQVEKPPKRFGYTMSMTLMPKKVR